MTTQNQNNNPEEMGADYFTDLLRKQREMEAKANEQQRIENDVKDKEQDTISVITNSNFKANTEEDNQKALDKLLNSFKLANATNNLDSFFVRVFPAELRNSKPGLHSVDVWLVSGYFQDAILARENGLYYENPFDRLQDYLLNYKPL